MDFIPDFIPWVGFGDDISVVVVNMLVNWLKKRSAKINYKNLPVPDTQS